MMGQRQLVLAVETTAALGASWPVLYAEYVEKIIRAFFEESTNQKNSGEMALVAFNTHGHSGFLFRQSAWTSNMNVFFNWLSSLTFEGGGFGDGAVAEALAEALMMCCPGPKPPVVPQQRHCLLIAASNPYRLPTPVIRPLVFALPNGQVEYQTEQWWLADAEAVAKAFPPCQVSLSVIAPRQLPQLRTIFNGAKRNPRAAETGSEAPKQQHLVLISDGFPEGKLAIRRATSVSNTTAAANASVPSALAAKLEPLLSNPASTPPQTAAARPMGVSTATGSMLGRQPISNGTAGVNMDSQSLLHPPAPAAPLPHPTASGVSAATDPLQTADTSASSQAKAGPGPGAGAGAGAGAGNPSALAHLSNNKMPGAAPSLGTVANGGPPGLSSSNVANPAAPAALAPSGAAILPGTGSVLTGLGPAGTAGMSTGLNAGLNPGLNPGLNAGLNPGLNPGLNAGLNPGLNAGLNAGLNPGLNAGLNPGLNVGLNAGLNAGLNPGLNAGLNAGLNPGLNAGMGLSAIGGGTLSANANSNAGIGVSTGGNQLGPSAGAPLQPGVSTVPVSGGAQSGIAGMGGATGALATAGVNAAMAPSSGLGQPSGIAAVVTPPQQASGALKYTKLWEGILAGQRQHKPVPICKLEGYRQTSASEKLAADWPSTMQIVRLIAQDYMNSKEYQGKAELLVFRPLSQHGFLVQLAEKKLCAVIQLPSQTLLLASTDKPGRMIGMLFPGDMVVFKPNVSAAQQQQQQPAGAVAPMAGTGQAMGQTGGQSNFSQGQLQGQMNPQQLNPQQLNPQQMNSQQMAVQQMNPQQMNPQQMNPQQMNPQQINPQQMNVQHLNAQQLSAQQTRPQILPGSDRVSLQGPGYTLP